MNGSSQRQTAWLTAVAFVLGTIAVPVLHLTLHALPHEHVAGATHYHHHEHDTDAEHGQPFDPQHGAGSAAHFALAISDDAAAPFILPLHALTPARFIAAAPSPLIAAAHVSVQRFRGPPRG